MQGGPLWQGIIFTYAEISMDRYGRKRKPKWKNFASEETPMTEIMAAVCPHPLKIWRYWVCYLGIAILFWKLVTEELTRDWIQWVDTLDTVRDCTAIHSVAALLKRYFFLMFSCFSFFYVVTRTTIFHLKMLRKCLTSQFHLNRHNQPNFTFGH